MTCKRSTIIAATMAATAASPVAADSFRLSIGAGHPDSAAWIASVEGFFTDEVSARVAERTDHEITWTHGYGGSICTLGECLETVESGLLDMAVIGTGFEPSKLQAHNFSYFVPFGPSDPVMGAEAAWRTYEEVPGLKTTLEEQYNQRFVGVSTIGNYGLITTFPWETVDDLEGEAIAGAGPNLPWLEGTGAVPVQSNLNEAYTSFQTGVYEGWIMYPDAIVSFALTEVTEQFADTGFGVIAFPVLTINLDTWTSLPEEVQEIMMEVGEEWSEENARSVAELQEEAYVQMEESGVSVREVAEEERAEWAQRIPNLPKLRHDEIVEAGGPGEAIYAYIEILQEMGHTFPRDWLAER